LGDDGLRSGHGCEPDSEPDYEREHEPARKSIALLEAVFVIGVFILIDHCVVAFRSAKAAHLAERTTGKHRGYSSRHPKHFCPSAAAAPTTR
jgi:hypothetical protein